MPPISSESSFVLLDELKQNTLEEVFDKVRGVIVFEGVKAAWRRAVCHLPNCTELGHIGILGVHKTIEQVIASEVLRTAVA